MRVLSDPIKTAWFHNAAARQDFIFDSTKVLLWRETASRKVVCRQLAGYTLDTLQAISISMSICWSIDRPWGLSQTLSLELLEMSLLCVCEKMVCTLYFKRTKYPEALLRSTHLLANISKSKRNTFPSDSKSKSNNNIGWAYSHSEEPKSWPVEFGNKTFQGSLLLGEWANTLWSVVYVCYKTWDSKSLFFFMKWIFEDIMLLFFL